MNRWESALNLGQWSWEEGKGKRREHGKEKGVYHRVVILKHNQNQKKRHAQYCRLMAGKHFDSVGK